MGLGRASIHVSKPLTDFMIQTVQDSTSFVANSYFPKIPSAKLIDKFFQFDQTNWQAMDDVRATGSEATQASLAKPSLLTFNIERHALKDYVAQDEIDEADLPIQPEMVAVEQLVEKMMINQDIDASKTIFTTTAVGGNTSLAAASKWDYTSSTTPLSDIDTWIDTVNTQCGRRANVGLTNQQVFTKLKRHAQLLDLVKYVQGGVGITEDIIAAACGLDKLVVSKPVYMSTAEGISQTVAFIWGKYFLVSYQNLGATPNKKQMTHSAKFVKQSKQDMYVKKYWDEAKDSWVIEPNMYYDFVVPATFAGYLAKDVIA